MPLFKRNSTILVAAFMTTPAVLANVADSSRDEAQEQIETIVVSTRLWNEPINNVPVSVSAVEVSPRVGSIARLDQSVSNVRVETSSVQTRVAIRGVLGYDSSLQQPVGYYVDEVLLPLGGSQLPALFNIDYLEVYKGSFSAIYGRHAEGGVLKVTTASPSWVNSGVVNVSSGITDGANGYKPIHVLATSLTAPLVENRLAGSLGVRYEKTDGTQTNLFTGSEKVGEVKNTAANWGFDASLTDKTNIMWRSHLSRKDTGKAGLRYLTGDFATPRFTVNYSSDSYDQKDSDIHSLRAVHTAKDYTITSISGFTRFTNNFQLDLDLGVFPVPETLMLLDDKMLSQELRIASDKKQGLKWLAGAYFFKQDTDADFTIGGSALLPRAQRVTDINQNGYAAYGQIDWDINDSLSLDIGVRYERIRKRGHQNFDGVFATEYMQDIDIDKLLPKASLFYALSKEQSVYISVASGYLPGGYNHTFAQSEASFTFAEETSNSVELGYKASLLHDTLQVAGAVFGNETRDKQIVDLQPGFVTAISNAAKATTMGVEFSADYRFSQAWEGFMRLGSMKAEASEYIVNVFNGSGFVSSDLSGNSLPMAPDFTYSAGLNYKARNNENGWFGRVVISGSSDYFFDSANLLTQPAYTALDVSVGYQFSAFSVSLEAENITDETIYSRSVMTNSGIVVEDTRARFLGINLSVAW